MTVKFLPHSLVKLIEEKEKLWCDNEDQCHKRAQVIVCTLIELEYVEGDIYQGIAIEKGSLEDISWDPRIGWPKTDYEACDWSVHRE